MTLFFNSVQIPCPFCGCFNLFQSDIGYNLYFGLLTLENGDLKPSKEGYKEELAQEIKEATLAGLDEEEICKNCQRKYRFNPNRNEAELI